jgi:hypothetical protein
VSGLEAQRVVEILGQAGVGFSEVTTQRATLEDVYLQLTGGEAEFRAGPDGTHTGGCTFNGTPPPPGPGGGTSGGNCSLGHPYVPTGPDGEAVADSYYFVDQPLTGNGTITAQVTSLTGVTSTQSVNVATNSTTATRPGLAAWAKAGILVTPTTTQGSAYAAAMATGSHGVRLQYDYTHDTAGLPGSVSAGSPRWLRLTRTADTLTAYDSTNGTTWANIGTAHLAGLPPTVAVGLFVTSPVSFQGNSSGAPTLATATFDHVSIDSHNAPSAWRGQIIGTGSDDFYPTLGDGSYHRSDSSFVVSGSGDIAPGVIQGLLTPAAGFAVLQAVPYAAQVSYPYTLANGYYPLAPWAGFLVLCAYAVVALAVATFLVRRRDA